MEIPVQPRREKQNWYGSGTWVLLTGLGREARELKSQKTGCLSWWLSGSSVPQYLPTGYFLLFAVLLDF